MRFAILKSPKVDEIVHGITVARENPPRWSDLGGFCL